MFSNPHRRFNPLLNTWILVSPQRIIRPWDGKIEKLNPTCVKQNTNNPLSPNGTRSNGEKNPDYQSIYLFRNDFPALLSITNENEKLPKESTDFDFFQSESANGSCHVMCFHPSSNVTLATMKPVDVVVVINKWISIIEKNKKKYDWIQIFENRGEMMGCSNPHPHCQIWSTNYLPTTPSTKDKTQLEYFQKHRRPMLHDYIIKEIENEERIIHLNNSWVCLVPFWAEWPFETMLVPRRLNVQRLNDLNKEEVTDLGNVMQVLLKKYNGLFDCDFPYSMGWHGAPTGSYLNNDNSHWVLHAIYYPPLLRSATIRKFFVGFELFSETQRDLTPEKAARALKDIVL